MKKDENKQGAKKKKARTAENNVREQQEGENNEIYG